MTYPDIGLAIDFNTESLEGIIGNRGMLVVHEISILCPCQITDPTDGAVGHADSTCDQCLGQGRLFREARQINGLITGLSSNRFWAQVGWVEAGDLSFSPSTHARRVNDFDRVILQVPMPVDGQVIQRGVSGPFSPRPRGLKDNEDLLFWEAGRAEAVWIEDRDGKVWRPGSYLLEGRKIIWPSGGGPKKGVQYSIKYEAYPEFIAWSTPFERWDRQRELGQRVMLRKSVLNADPAKRLIRPPWKELLDRDPASRTDIYGNYSVMDRNTVEPSR